MSNKIVREVWGSKYLRWIAIDAVGSAGGILLLWDSRYVVVSNTAKGEFSVSAEVEDLVINKRWLITLVYGPNSNSKRPDLWRELNSIRVSWNGACCVGSDWNIVRFPSEKLGSGHISAAMSLFSDWFNSHSLIDLQLGGASFTSSNHQTPPSMSRLDRFLVSTDWLDLYPEVIQLALSKPTSDHCPIVLDSRPERWGAAPFRFELAWLENKGFFIYG